MTMLSFDLVLYPDSPFLPQIQTENLWHVTHLVTNLYHHPAVAIAHEIRFLSDRQIKTIDEEIAWVSEKFHTDSEELDLYFFGLITPPSLIIAADRLRYLPPMETLDYLVPPIGEESIESLRSYLKAQFPKVRKMISASLPEPMLTAKPIYDHCSTEVFSEDFWYLVEVEASQRIYREVATLFNPRAGLRQGERCL